MELIIPNEIKPQAFAIEKLYDSETNEEISTVNPGKQGQTVILSYKLANLENTVST